jgi:hypothetical protein
MRILLFVLILAIGSESLPQSSRAQAIDNPTGAIGYVVSEQCSKERLATNDCHYEIVTDVKTCAQTKDCYLVATRRMALADTAVENHFELSCYDGPHVTQSRDPKSDTSNASTIFITPFSAGEAARLRYYNIWYGVCLNEFLKFPGDDQ